MDDIDDLESKIKEELELEEEPEEEREDLPYLVDRIKAVLLDSLIIIAAMAAAAQIFHWLQYTGENGRMIVYAIIWFYEPIMVMTGGTLGHRAMKLRVRNIDDESKNLNFLFAMLRFITKILLSWLSLITVTANKNKRAIHDMAGKSIMVRIDFEESQED